MGTILVTGGAGYIGSHTCVELLEAGYEVVVVDNLCNSSRESLTRVEEITGKSLHFDEVDLLDAEAPSRVFAAHDFDAVIHFAGLKAVGESVEIPLRYYDNNLAGTLHLLEAMQRHGVKRLVLQLVGHGLRRPRAGANHARTFRCRRPTPTAAPS